MQSIQVRSRRLFVSSVLALAVSIVVIAATPALAVGSYTFTTNSGASFQLLSANNLVNGVVDDQTFRLGRVLTGINHLPFKLHVFGNSYKNVWVSSNGNVQFGGTSATAAFTNDCLPSSTFSRDVVMPFWDDLFFDSNDLSEPFREGIFLRTTRAAPNRRFIISWQGHRFSDAGAHVLAQVIFREDSNNPRFVYGQSGGGSATIGVQSQDLSSFRQVTCNSGTSNAVVQGERIDFLYSP